MFNVIINVVWFKSTILLFVFYLPIDPFFSSCFPEFFFYLVFF